MNRNWILGLVGLAAGILILGCLWQTTMMKKSGKPELTSNTAQKNENTEQTAVPTNKCEKQTFAMDTFMTFTAYGEHAEAAVDTAMEEVRRLDAMLSTGNPDSEIGQLNTTGQAGISDEIQQLFMRSMEIYKKTDGLFDITIYPLMELWGFPSHEYHVASEAELDALLPYVNAENITLSDKKLTLANGQKIDFGAIAKGYTSSRLMDIYRMNGITSGMVYLGGNVQTLGTKPDGNKWTIGIQDPDEEQGEVLMALSVQDKAVITSGGYERYFEEDGKRYIHILDPRTGRPVENDLVSVTIVSPDGTLADALSTSLFIMGKEAAIEFWRENQEEFQMILLTRDGNIYVTEELTSDVQCKKKYETIK